MSDKDINWPGEWDQVCPHCKGTMSLRALDFNDLNEELDCLLCGRRCVVSYDEVINDQDDEEYGWFFLEKAYELPDL